MMSCLCRQVVSGKNKIVYHLQVTGRKVCNAECFVCQLTAIVMYKMVCGCSAAIGMASGRYGV